MQKELSYNIFKKMRKLLKIFSGLFLVMAFNLSVISVSAVEENGGGIENVATLVKFDSGVNADNFLRVLIALVSVILIIFFLSTAVKKFKLLPGGSGRLIKIIAGISLSGKDRLLLIQVGNDQILISASPGGIRKIHELTHCVETEVVSPVEKPAENGFLNLLNSVTSRQRA